MAPKAVHRKKGWPHGHSEVTHTWEASESKYTWVLKILSKVQSPSLLQVMTSDLLWRESDSVCELLMRAWGSTLRLRDRRMTDSAFLSGTFQLWHHHTNPADMEIIEIRFSKLLIRNRLTEHFNLLYLSVLVLTQTAVLPTISGFSGFPGSLHRFLGTPTIPWADKLSSPGCLLFLLLILQRSFLFPLSTPQQRPSFQVCITCTKSPACPVTLLTGSQSPSWQLLPRHTSESGFPSRRPFTLQTHSHPAANRVSSWRAPLLRKAPPGAGSLPSLCWRLPLLSLLKAAIRDSLVSQPFQDCTHVRFQPQPPHVDPLLRSQSNHLDLRPGLEWKLSTDKPLACTFPTFFLTLLHFSFLIFVVPLFFLLLLQCIFFKVISNPCWNKTG